MEWVTPLLLRLHSLNALCLQLSLTGCWVSYSISLPKMVKQGKNWVWLVCYLILLVGLYILQTFQNLFLFPSVQKKVL